MIGDIAFEAPPGGEGSHKARQVLRRGADQLSRAGVASPYADARALLAHVWGVEEGSLRRAEIMGDVVPTPVLDRFEDLIAERARRVPLQHLTGSTYFAGIDLACGPGVFVPRPETELLVGLVLDAVADVEAPVIVDLCTGSGAIALAIKTSRPDAWVGAVELAPEAYAWACRNRERLGLDVDIRLGDAVGAFGDLLGQVDAVASNPPYIPDGMVPVDPEVRDHDPEIALYGGSADGLRIPVAVAARAAQLLRPGGTLVMEHADSQGDSLPAALRTMGGPAGQRVTGQSIGVRAAREAPWASECEGGVWREVRDVADLAGRPRHTVALRG